MSCDLMFFDDCRMNVNILCRQGFGEEAYCGPMFAVVGMGAVAWHFLGSVPCRHFCVLEEEFVQVPNERSGYSSTQVNTLVESTEAATQ